MALHQVLILYVLSFTFLCANSYFIDLVEHGKPWLNGLQEVVKSIADAIDDTYMDYKDESLEDSDEEDIVNIQDYYESQCTACRIFYNRDLLRALYTFGKRLNIHGYPYGKANTTVHPDGTYDIQCQHGPDECYGNQLHACTYHLLKNYTEAIIFNACMMEWNEDDRGSNDAKCDKCGKKMNVDSEAIKACAKSQKGRDLHKYYGDETRKVKFGFVPHVLLNGIAYNVEIDFIESVCKAFKNPPESCNK